MHGLLPVGDTMHISGKCVAKVTGHLSERSFVQNEVVQIPKFDSNPNLNTDPTLIRFGQMTLQTSELSPVSTTLQRVVQCECCK